jgi:phage N-6-adenine-methyltransferase
MVSRVLFSSNNERYGTPQWLYDKLDKRFNFTLDAAADGSNTKCKRWLGPGSKLASDALKTKWGKAGQERVWLNFPYTRNRSLTHAWVIHAFKEHLRGNTVVMLAPSRTGSPWFRKIVLPYLKSKGENWWKYIVFLRGRLRFEVDGEPSKDVAPFPSILVFFTQDVP